MFYMGNLFIFLALNLASRPMIGVIHYGLRSPYLVGLVYCALLFCIGVRMVAQAFRMEHTQSLAGRYCGVFLLFISLISCANITGRLILADLLQVFSFLIPGVLINLYNNPDKAVLPEKKDHVKEMEIPEPRPLSVDCLEVEDRIMLRLSRAAMTDQAYSNPEFMENIKKSQAYLTGIRQTDYSFNKHVLELIDGLLKIYLDLCSQIIYTEKTKELLNKVMDSFNMITKSFETMYDTSLEEKAFGIENSIKILEYKLKSEGLLGSDFENIAE